MLMLSKMASHPSWYVKDKKVMLFTKLSFNSSYFILYTFTHATIRRFEGNGPEIRLEPEGALCIISILIVRRVHSKIIFHSSRIYALYWSSKSMIKLRYMHEKEAK